MNSDKVEQKRFQLFLN